MRWWMAALLAVVCISIGMLLPLPAMEYTEAFIPTEETAPPLVNIGLGSDGTPRPISTPVPTNEENTENGETETSALSLTFSSGLSSGISDALFLSEAVIPITGQSSYNGILLDIDRLEWFQHQEYEISRAGFRLALSVHADFIQIIDTQAQSVVLEIETASVCPSPAYFSWDQDANDNIAVCIMDENMGNAATLLYEASTGDQTLFQGFSYPRFSPDARSLYIIEQGEVSALYRVSPPSGQPKRITADTVFVHSHQPVSEGVVVRGTNLEAEEAFLLRLNEDGAEIANYQVSNDVATDSDFLFPVFGGHAYFVSTSSGEEQFFLINIDDDNMTELEPGDVPVSYLDGKLIVRNRAGMLSYLPDGVSGNQVEIELTR